MRSLVALVIVGLLIPIMLVAAADLVILNEPDSVLIGMQMGVSFEYMDSGTVTVTLAPSSTCDLIVLKDPGVESIATIPVGKSLTFKHEGGTLWFMAADVTGQVIFLTEKGGEGNEP